MQLQPYKHKLQSLLSVLGDIDPHTNWDQALAKIVAFMGADRGTLYRLNPSTDELCSTVFVDGMPLDIHLKVGVGLAGWVAMTRIPLVINDVLKDDRFDGRWDLKSGYTTRNVLAVPLVVEGGYLIGVLQMLNKPGGFDDLDRDALVAIAHVCGLGMEIERLEA